MPLSDSYRRDLDRLRDREHALRKEMDRYESAAAKADEECRRHLASAQRATSASTAKTYLGSAERARKKALNEASKATTVSKKLADNSRDQTNKRRQLESALKSEQQAADRETEKRRRKEKDHAREIARLATPTVHYVHIKPAEPEKLRVVYLTSNAGLDLRLDAEVRQVQQALRGARYRDLVDVTLRPAATFPDLLDVLNDERPHIVHFSGHAGSGSIAMENGDLTDPEHNLIGFDLLVKALSATDTPPSLLVLNACDTLDGASVILPAVPVVIAMSDNVLDVAAILFAQQFYAAIASGQSIGSALRQAKVKIEAVLLDEDASALPQHIARDDVDIDQLVLVKPEAP